MDKNKLDKSKLKLDKAIKEFEKAEKKLPENKKKQRQQRKLLKKEKNLKQELVQEERTQSNFTPEPKPEDIKNKSNFTPEPKPEDIKNKSDFTQEPKQDIKSQSKIHQEPVPSKRKQSNFTQEPKQQDVKSQSKLHQELKQDIKNKSKLHQEAVQEEKKQSGLYQEPVPSKRNQSNFTPEPKPEDIKNKSNFTQEPKQQDVKSQSKLHQEPVQDKRKQRNFSQELKLEDIKNKSDFTQETKQDIKSQSGLYQESKQETIKKQSKLYQEPKQDIKSSSKLHQESKQDKRKQVNFTQEPKPYIKIDKEVAETSSDKKENLLKESTFKSKLKENRWEASEEINTLISKQNEANKKYRNFINHEFKPETIQEYYKKHAILIQLEEKNKYNLRVNTSFKELPESFIIKLRPREEVPVVKKINIGEDVAEPKTSKLKDVVEPKASKLKDTSNLKNTSKLNFKEELKSINIDDSYKIDPINSKNSKNNIKKLINVIGNKVQSQAHKKVEELEKDNTGLEAVHRTEKSIEKTYSLTKRAYQHHKNKPYVRVEKAQKKLKKAEINYSYQKYLYENKFHFQKTNGNNVIVNNVSNLRQKRAIKRRYAKLYRQKYKYNKYKNGYSVANNILSKTSHKIIQVVQKDPKIFIIILVSFFFVFLISSVVSTTILTGQAILQAFLTTSYASSTDAMLETYENYQALENDLKETIESIEDDYPGFDEYVYDIDNIGHNPHELTSYLSVIFKSYNAELVQVELENLFELQYTLTITERLELRYNDDGVPYQAKVLTVELENKSIKEVAYEVFDDDEYELFLNYLDNKGNMPTLFDDIYSEDTNQDGSYEVPADHLTDQEFAELLAEAEKYIGYPYVWGGSSPDTSFDCSGFICWVYGIPRTTAQQIYNQCTVVSSDEVKPGDLVFFTGTYSSLGAVSHIGMYVGDGMMLHCGDPIGYASLSNSYWSSHFYAYARLN